MPLFKISEAANSGIDICAIYRHYLWVRVPLVDDAVSFQGGGMFFTALLLTDNDWVSMREVATNSDGDSASETKKDIP
jgi:hypothetical protein